MKNRYLYMLGVMLLLSSCQSFLEEMPQNKLKPTTTDDYGQLLNKGYVSEQIMPYLDILSDDVDLIADNHIVEGADYGDIYVSAYMWEPNHEASMPGGDKAFAKLYESIFYTNVVLENIDQATGVVLDEEEVQRTRNNIKGEAYALRAYSYFYLVNLYAKYYDPSTCATDPGVPVIFSTTAKDQAYIRNSVKEVYDLMVEDLKKGIQLLEDNPVNKEEKLKFTALSATALLARVYLYMQEWDAAIECAKKVIGENKAIFNLFEAGEELSVDYNEGDMWIPEIISGRDYLDMNNENVLFVNGVSELMPAMSYWMVTTFSVNEELAGIYEPDDVRRCYFMYTHTMFSPKLTFAKNRYFDVFDTFDAATYHAYSRVIRTEEMYLILAEAYAHQDNGVGEAIRYLNTLRAEKFRAGTYRPLQAGNFTPSSLLDFIALERRKELCFEGHRWFDLRRTTRPPMERVGYDSRVAKLEKNDLRYVLQIPKKELGVNPEIGANPR